MSSTVLPRGHPEFLGQALCSSAACSWHRCLFNFFLFIFLPFIHLSSIPLSFPSFLSTVDESFQTEADNLPPVAISFLCDVTGAPLAL